MFTVTFTYSKSCYKYWDLYEYLTESRSFDTEAQARDYVNRLGSRSWEVVRVPNYSPAHQPLRGVTVCNGDQLAFCWSAPTKAVENRSGWVITADSICRW